MLSSDLRLSVKMKFLHIFALIFLTLAHAKNENGIENFQKVIKNKILHFIDKWIATQEEILKMKDMISNVGDITVVVNEFADKLMANLQKFMRNHHFDCLQLPNTTLKLEPTGHMDLTNGILKDLSQISRTNNVTVVYNSTLKKIKIILPFKFDLVQFSYDYHTKVAFISMHGGLHGTIKKATFNTEISFSFKKYKLFLDHLDMKHTGDITVKFTGNKIIDWLTNAMAKVVTGVLHPLIVGEVGKAIRISLRSSIQKINDFIAKILHPTMMQMM